MTPLPVALLKGPKAKTFITWGLERSDFFKSWSRGIGAHKLLAIEALKPTKVHVVNATDVPNPRWLQPGSISAAQQAFGAALLDRHPLILIPSVVSAHSWNLLIDVRSACGLFKLHGSEPFGLDTRLNPS